MSYNPNVPQTGDFISVSQVDFLQNFNALSSIFERNHNPLEDGMESERGKHFKVGFSEQSGDPTTSANVFSIYTKDNAGIPELYGREENDGTVYRWTKNGRLSPSLRLEAYVIFDIDGNILKNPNGEELKYNVSEITIPNPLFNGRNVRDDWIVVFENNISTDKYFWVIGAFYGIPGSPVFEQSLFTSTTPYKFGSYGDAVQTGQFRLMTKNINGLSTASQLITKVIQVQIFTVA